MLAGAGPARAAGAYLGLDGDVERGSRGLRADGGGAQWAREMQEGVGFGHDAGGGFRGAAV